MNIALMTQLVLALLCTGVIVQTMRLIKRLKLVTNGSLGETVKALIKATNDARTVLDGLRHALSGDGKEVATHVTTARTLSDELSLLIGIANAVADRLVDVGAAAPAQRDERATPFSKPPQQSLKPQTRAQRTTKTKRPSAPAGKAA